MAQKRIVVMNGQRLSQEAPAPGKWEVVKVDKAGSIKPGVYNLAAAKLAQDGQKYSGAIVETDREAVYQQSQSGLIKHESRKFSKLPEIGTLKGLEYTQSGNLTVSDVQAKSNTNTRSRSR